MRTVPAQRSRRDRPLLSSYLSLALTGRSQTPVRHGVSYQDALKGAEIEAIFPRTGGMPGGAAVLRDRPRRISHQSRNLARDRLESCEKTE